MALILLVCAAPLPLGSNRPVFWAVNALLAAAILALAAAERQPRADWRTSRAVALCGFGFLAMGGWMAVQGSVLSPSALHHFVWRDIELWRAAGAISLNPSVTWATLCWWLTLAATAPAIRLATDPHGTMLLIRVFALCSASIAFFGILSELLSWNTVGLLPKDAYRGWVTGTFVNRNHAATFFAIGALAALSLAAQRNAETPGGGGAARLRVGRHARLPQLFWLLIAAFLMASVYLTGSRGGIASGAAGALVLFALWLRHQKQAGVIAALFVTIMGTSLGASYLLGLGVFSRGDTEASDEARWLMYRQAIRAVLDRPILGHGAGAYPDVQPLYQVPGMDSNVLWTHAHSVYLELVATLGLPITLLALIIVAGPAWRLLSTALRDRTRSPALLLSVGSLVTVSLHSLIDFSLQVQAVAIWFAAALGLGIGQVVANDAPSEPRSPRNWASIERWTLVSIAGLTCVLGLRIAAIEAAVPPSLWLREIRPLYAAGPIPELTVRVSHALAERISDRDLMVAELGLCHAELNAAVKSGDRQGGIGALLRCLGAVDAGLRAAPASPALWAKRAEILFGIGGVTPEFAQSLANSYRFGPLHGPAMSIRIPISLTAWSDLNRRFPEQIAKDLAHAPLAAIAALARNYLANRSRRDAIRTALSHAAPDALVFQLEEELRVQSDGARRAADRVRVAKRAQCRDQLVRSGPIGISAVGTSFDGDPLMRVWVNGSAVGDFLVTPSKHGTVFQIPLPAGVAPLSVEVEFLNDSWQGENRDRNLGITSLSIGGIAIPSGELEVPEFNEPFASVEADIAWLLRNGSLRYESGCLDGSGSPEPLWPRP